MSAELSNVATADGYTDTNRLSYPGSVRLRMLVQNASIVYQLGRGYPAFNWEPTEHHLIPGRYSLDVVADAIQVRSYVAGVPARATVTLLRKDEVTA
jgi:hypothetical protein